MKSINEVFLIGNCGGDIQVKSTPSGTAVANFTLATTNRSKDKNSGEWVENTEWHNVVLWQRLAEIAGEYLKKGSRCFIKGRLQTRSWEKDGVKRYTTEIVGSDLILLDNKPTRSGQPAQEEADQLVPF